MTIMGTEGLRSDYHKVRLGPPTLGGLTLVDLYTSLPSGVPGTWVATLLGDSATTTRRTGLSRARKGSPEDQDERLQLETRISRDLNRPPFL